MSRLDKIGGLLGFGLVSRVTLQEAIATTTRLGDEPQHSPAGRRKRCPSAAVTSAAISGLEACVVLVRDRSSYRVRSVCPAYTLPIPELTFSRGHSIARDFSLAVL